MNETVGDIIKKLINTNNYLSERSKISDDFIIFVKDNLPTDYGYIREKEEAYQNLKSILDSSTIVK
jgi:hypothetical protein